MNSLRCAIDQRIHFNIAEVSIPAFIMLNTLKVRLGYYILSITAILKFCYSDCRIPGILYRGTQNVTKSGLPCQPWRLQIPHQHNYDVFTLATENFCRNFDQEDPWCFTTKAEVRLESCEVDVCENPCYNMSVLIEQTIVELQHCRLPDQVDCSNINAYVKCILGKIEKKYNVTCSEPRGAFLQMKDSLQALSLIKSQEAKDAISSCNISPCSQTEYIINDNNLGCLQRYQVTILSAASQQIFCRSIAHLMNCVVSSIAEKSNATCTTKDKNTLFAIFNKFLSTLRFPYDVTTCAWVDDCFSLTQINKDRGNSVQISQSALSEFALVEQTTTLNPVSDGQSSTKSDVTPLEDQSASSLYVIGAIVCSVLLAVVVILVLVFVICKRRRGRDKDGQRAIHLRYVPKTLPMVPTVPADESYKSDDKKEEHYDVIDDDSHHYEELTKHSIKDRLSTSYLSVIDTLNYSNKFDIHKRNHPEKNVESSLSYVQMSDKRTNKTIRDSNECASYMQPDSTHVQQEIKENEEPANKEQEFPMDDQNGIRASSQSHDYTDCLSPKSFGDSKA